MISDLSSFILEYAVTGKPLLYLKNPKGPATNADGEFFDYCARAETEEQIGAFLDEVEAGVDSCAAVRRSRIAEFMYVPDEGVGTAAKRARPVALARPGGEDAGTHP